jgi:hypothetical protein
METMITGDSIRVEDHPPSGVVIVEHEGVPVLAEAKKRVPRDAPKWETEARDRVKAAIKKFCKPLADLVQRDANEGDTRLLITDFLCEGLGYDKYSDLTTEYRVKGEFADYGVRIDKQLVAFIELKRATTKLNIKHLRQVEMYAVNEGVAWAMLTNGVDWQVYHIGAGMPVEIDLALETSLLGDPTVVKAAPNQMFYLTKEAFKRGLIDELWKAKKATSPRSLAEVLLSETVLDAVRKELRRKTGHQVDPKEIARLLRTTVIRPDC